MPKEGRVGVDPTRISESSTFFCFVFCCASMTPSTLLLLMSVEPVSTKVGSAAFGFSAAFASETFMRL